MLSVVVFIFWTAFIVLFLVYVGYPLLVVAMSFVWRHPKKLTQITPSVSLVISAYNEAEVIAEKLENSFALDYPSDLLEIVVISDASTDGTDEIVRSFEDRGVRLLRQESRRGKSHGLTQSVPQCRGDFIVFSDANSLYDKGAIRALVRNFGSSDVGFVVGHQRYLPDASEASVSESLYWYYETYLKTRESHFGGLVCGDGAIYAIPRGLFQPLRDDDINDFTLPLRIIAQGYRGVFEPDAFCYEETADDMAGEFRRRVRIVNRSFRAVTRVSQTLNPFRVGWFSVHLLFRKVLRWLSPIFLVALLASNVALALQGGIVYPSLLFVQLVFYGLALGRCLPVVRNLRVVYLPYYFCLMNLAFALGIIGVLSGKRISTWTPPRAAEECGSTHAA